MKKLFLASILVFTFAIFAFAQETPNYVAFSVSGPSDLKNPAIFTANVLGISEKNIGYNWTVSGGTIIEGQGTSVIKVQSKIEGDQITATVEITGLPNGCPKVASAGFIICPEPEIVSIKLDEFSVIPPRLRKERLDALFVQMNNDPSSEIYIVERFKSNTKRADIVKKFGNLKYWLQMKKIDTSRISFFIGDSEDNLTEFWLRPPGALPSAFENSVEISLWNYQKVIAKLFANKQKSLPKKQTSRKSVRKH